MSTLATQAAAQLDALKAAGILTPEEYADAVTRLPKVITTPTVLAPGAPSSPQGPPAAPSSPQGPPAAPSSPQGPPAAAAATQAPTTVIPSKVDVEIASADDPDVEPETIVPPAEVPVTLPCPVCATDQTVVTSAPSTQADDLKTATGVPVAAGDTVQVCKHCSAIISVLEGDVTKAASELEAAYQDALAKVRALESPAPDPTTTTEGVSGDGTAPTQQ